MSQNFRDSENVEQLIKALDDKNYNIWSKFSYKVDNTWSVEPFLKALSSQNPEVRSWAAFSLGKIGDERAIQPLISVLGDEDKELDERAIVALTGIGESVTEAVIQALTSKNAFVRQSAIHVLKGLRATQAIEVLNYLLLNDLDEEVRILSASTLGEFKNPKSIEVLIQALKDKDARVTGSVSEALGKLGNKEAINPLLANLNSEDALVRYSAAEALGEIGDELVLLPLRQIVQNDMGESYGLKVREAASKAIEKIQQRLLDLI